jgi:hypothetical protein
MMMYKRGLSLQRKPKANPRCYTLELWYDVIVSYPIQQYSAGGCTACYISFLPRLGLLNLYRDIQH